ncbi:MAG: alpha/beta hydrolase [Stenotrophobium sp.]
MQKLLRGAVRIMYQPVFNPRVPIAMQRAWAEMIGKSTLKPRGRVITPQAMNGVPAECVHDSRTSPLKSPGAVLYLHGGGYILGSPATHRAITASLARATGLKVHVPAYRLAPEHPYPAALDDALASYRWLLDNGHKASLISIAGDSAGGGLALATTLAIRDAGLPMPGALVLISPWLDLTLSGESMQTRATRDPALRATRARWAASLYCKNTALDHTGCSPLFADLKGLPPTLVQVGSDEILYSDTERFTEKARAAGIEVQMHCYDGLWHDFQLHVGLLRQADEAIAEIAAFLFRPTAA